MTDQEYKRAFALLTEKLGRVPTTRDKEWVELSERLRKSYLPAEEQCSQVNASPSGAVNAGNGNGASLTERMATTATPAESPSTATSAEPSGPMTTGAEPQRRRPEVVGSSATAATDNAREGTGEAMSRPGAIQTGSGDRTTGEAGNGAGINSYPVPRSNWDRPSGQRGPNGGVLAVCALCRRVWERERRRGRPSARCGECK